MLDEPLASAVHRREIAVEGSTWVDLERPTSGEMAALARDFGLDPALLDTALNRGEATGLWPRDDYVHIAVQLPTLSTGRRSGRVVATPMSMFVARDFFVTIHTGEIRPLIRLFQQCETDPNAREAAFALGIPGLLYVVAQRLVDAAAASRGRIDRARNDDEMDARPSRATLAQAVRLRADARAVLRLTAPLPGLIRALGVRFPIAPGSEEAWSRVAARAERLVIAVEDDLAALEGVFLAASASGGLEQTRLLRAILVIAALTLPALTMAVILSMPIANPLAAQPNGYAISLAIVGLVFLAALAAVKRGNFL